MSVYQVQKLLFNLHNDLELKQKYKENPQEILKKYDLAESELKALLEPDVGSLYRMGTHTYLLWAYGTLMGVRPDVYFKQIGRDLKLIVEVTNGENSPGTRGTA